MMLQAVADFTKDVLQTGFRLAAWPAEPGLREIGKPGPMSPVLVTCNFDFTVRRVLRAMRANDAWLVVAPSSGINVWCAASGGLLSTHQVVTALKTSGVDERVNHRRAILPQLAATGVRAREVERRSRWQVKFGPVYAQDLPRYLALHETKTDDMRHVRFGMAARLEMAVTWAVPMTLIAVVALLLLYREWMLPAVAMIWLLAIAVFTIYDRVLGQRFPVLALAAAVLALGLTALAGGGLAALGASPAASIAIAALLTFDYSGSTPIEGGSHFKEARWRIKLDTERCKGVCFCWQVCPEACFEKREDLRKVEIAHSDRCIRCGACVVQCPTDALSFEEERGSRIEPATIRRFKLNLFGRRTVDAGAEASHSEPQPQVLAEHPRPRAPD
jgi:ferredoxin